MIYTLDAVAALLQITPQQVRTLLHIAVDPLERRTYYLYSVPRRETAVGAPIPSTHSERTLVLFQSPDDALAFLQQLGIPGVPQVRPIRREAVVLRMLGDASIREVVFFEWLPEWLPNPLRRDDLALLPGTYTINRSTLLSQIASDEASANL